MLVPRHERAVMTCIYATVTDDDRHRHRHRWQGIVDQSGLLGLICYARAQRSHQNIVKHLSLLSVRLA